MNKQKNNSVVVVGAGIAGLCAAYILMRDGYAVDIYDPAGFPAENASWRAGGMLAPYSEIEHMPPAWVEAGLAGIAFWKRFVAAHEVREEIDFRETGSLLLAHQEDRYILERFRAHFPQGQACRSVPAPEIDALEPMIKGRFKQGVYLEQEACLDPRGTIGVLRSILEQSGLVDFHSKVASPQDLSAQYTHVIDARGMGASTDDEALRGVKGEIVIVRNTDFSLSRPVRLMHPRYPLYIVPRANHVFMIGATNVESSDGEHATVRSAMELLSAAYSLHSSFGEAEILEICAGIRPSYADNLPRVQTNGNVIQCNGLYRHGFLLAPVLALCVRAMLQGQRYEFEDILREKTDERETDENSCERRGQRSRSAA